MKAVQTTVVDKINAQMDEVLLHTTLNDLKEAYCTVSEDEDDMYYI